MLGDEIFGRADEVVEHVLLVGFHAPFVPGAPILAATAQIRHGIHTTQLEPAGNARGEPRLHRNIEATVTVQNRRVVAVEGGALAGHDIKRHSRAVLARVEHLLCLVVVGIESREVRCLPQRARAAREIEPIDTWRRGKAAVGVKSLAILDAPREAGRLAETGEFHFTEQLSAGV